MMYDGHNPFIINGLDKEELVEAYIFFAGIDIEAQEMVIEAIDRKYSIEELWATY